MLNIRAGIFFLLILLLSGCAEEKQVLANDTIFLDYAIRGDEDSDITCTIHVREGGPEGRGVVLRDPARLMLDGELLEADSADFTGGYYEISLPLHLFAGRRTITYIDSEGREHNEQFTFRPFSLAPDLPGQLPARPFEIRLSGVEKRENRMRLIMINTDREVNDVNKLVHVTDGRLTVDQDLIRQIGTGMIILQIYSEEERPLENGPDGRISITYGIQREIELVDP